MPKSDRRVEELIRIYTGADAELAALMARAQAQGSLAQKRYRSRILVQVRGILAKLKEVGTPAAQRAVLATYEDGQLLARAPGETRLQGAFGGPHRVAISALTDSLLDRLDGSTVAVGRSVNDVFRQETLRAATERLAVGNPLQGGAKALETALRSSGHTGFVDKAGRQWTLANYAEMAIQTITRQAASEGLKNRMLQQGYDLIFIPAHVHAQDSCSKYEGKVWSLNGNTPGYPVIDRLCPWHPRCRHTAVAAKENFL